MDGQGTRESVGQVYGILWTIQADFTCLEDSFQSSVTINHVWRLV